MRFEKKGFVIFLTMVLVLTFMLPNIYAQEDNRREGPVSWLDSRSLTDGIAGSLGGKALTFLGDGVEKLFSTNPWVHGILGGGFSGVQTFVKLNKTTEFTLEKDKVNISDNPNDYIDKTELDNYYEYGDNLYEDRFQAYKNTRDGTYTYKHLALTDENILEIEFLNTIDVESLDSENSPKVRLSETTEELYINTLDNNRVMGQSRGILFEDINSTIKNEYEYRYLVLEYPIADYKKNLNIPLKVKDILKGNNIASFLLTPFSTGAQFIKPEVVAESESTIKKIKQERNVDFKKQPFHLLFNSYKDENINLDLEQMDCLTEDGLILGTSGTESLPRVTFDWKFEDDLMQNGATTKAINGLELPKSTWCDVDSIGTDTGIFCDSTQFTIEILNKIREIKWYVDNYNNQFVCPTPGVTGDLVTDVNNVGLTSLNSEYDGISKVYVDYSIDGNLTFIPGSTISPHVFQLQLTLYDVTGGAQNQLDQTTIDITQDQIINNDMSGTHEFTNLSYYTTQKDLRVEAELVNFAIFTNIKNITADDELTNNFTTDKQGCDLEHTSQNLKWFAKNAPQHFEDTKLVNFRSLLMQDGYSTDFKEDFDQYYRTTLQSAGVPTWYTDNQTGLHKYFTSENFKYKSIFDSDPNKLVLPGPGRYEVQLNITFDDKWRLFDLNDNMVGDIEIVLNKELPPEQDAPVYYLPFNGLVGIQTPNARQGYGIDYINDVIDLDHDILMRSEPFTSSNTINTLNVDNVKDFAKMNNGQTRGRILSIQGNDSPELKYSPSNATPIIAKFTNESGDAFGFYKLSLGAPLGQGGEVAKPGLNLAKWTGVGECKDFSGVSVQEMFLNRRDILATESKLAPYTPSQTAAYGFEWENPEVVRMGNVFLRSILYTPANFTTGTGISVLYADNSNDDLMFYLPDSSGQITSGKNVELYSVYNDIKSLKDIYSLVSEKKACIDYGSNFLNVYYNPKKVTEELLDTDSDVQNQFVENNGGCIQN